MSNLLIEKQDLCTNVVNTAKNNCAHALVKTLEELGVSSIFGYPGASVLSVYHELSESKIRHFLVRHEQAAVHAAEGYARTSGKPGVVLVTSGPGFTNTVTGIANAYADSTPLVILAGDVPSNSNKGKIFQKVDIISLTKSCSKKSYLLSSKDDIRQVIIEAFEVAASGEKGPVVIAMPRNILESVYSPKIKKDFHKKKKAEIKNDDINTVIKLLNRANSPLILVGGGACGSVGNIKKLAEFTKIPVVSTLMGIGTFPSKNKCYLGMIGVNGATSANTAFNNSDLILAFGVSFSDRSTCKNNEFGKNKKIISINLKKAGNGCGMEIIADSNEFLERLLSCLNDIPDFTAWHKYLEILCEKNSRTGISADCLHSSCVIETIYEYTKDFEPIVVTDVGQHQMLTAQYFNFSKPYKFITSGGLGTMGFGLPASIGAQIANPSALVLNITGDGSFQMNLQELATCREHNIPVKIIIMNNSYLGMVRQMQEKLYNKCYQSKMINPDFTKIAEAYDLFAVRVKTAEELYPALHQAISHNGTAIVDILIDSYEVI